MCFYLILSYEKQYICLFKDFKIIIYKPQKLKLNLVTDTHKRL